MKICIRCDEQVADARAAIGFRTCLVCGEAEARKRKFTVVPMAKSNYTVVSDPAVLRQLNKNASYV